MRIAPTKGMLPEDRPVGGYCKCGSIIVESCVMSSCQRIDPLEGTASCSGCTAHHEQSWLPEDRPVGGYCKSIPKYSSIKLLGGCQRIDPLEGTARKYIHNRIPIKDSRCQRIDPLEGTARRYQVRFIMKTL